MAKPVPGEFTLFTGNEYFEVFYSFPVTLPLNSQIIEYKSREFLITESRWYVCFKDRMVKRLDLRKELRNTTLVHLYSITGNRELVLLTTLERDKVYPTIEKIHSEKRVNKVYQFLNNDFIPLRELDFDAVIQKKKTKERQKKGPRKTEAANKGVDPVLQSSIELRKKFINGEELTGKQVAHLMGIFPVCEYPRTEACIRDLVSVSVKNKEIVYVLAENRKMTRLMYEAIIRLYNTLCRIYKK
jgi:hypothetical protein